ncbi:MAG: hypothetical protein UT32_C0020G0001 [Parcubacteria group bacterium GW2011_GWC2_39_14]|nr:MAG: hypothetical protein UT32_C0020G0001 [Parcubacteria group bacterium GW2011_GWC2_39_14]KKR54114.1 MAG: hypothetical protein UT91_C0020G0001 [Parcubacteria group bacterium GW2011_GWA2_40_23]
MFCVKFRNKLRPAFREKLADKEQGGQSPQESSSRQGSRTLRSKARNRTKPPAGISNAAAEQNERLADTVPAEAEAKGERGLQIISVLAPRAVDVQLVLAGNAVGMGQ